MKCKRLTIFFGLFFSLFFSFFLSSDTFAVSYDLDIHDCFYIEDVNQGDSFVLVDEQTCYDIFEQGYQDIPFTIQRVSFSISGIDWWYVVNQGIFISQGLFIPDSVTSICFDSYSQGGIDPFSWTFDGNLLQDSVYIPSSEFSNFDNSSIILTFYDSCQFGSSSPSGNLDITQNGQYDVTNYATATVNVPIPEPEVIPGDYHDDLQDIKQAIFVCGAVLLVIYFFYCIYRMIIKGVKI